MLAWARALGEFGATITFAGNFPGTTRTIPMTTYLSLQSDPPQALILSLLLITVSFAVLIGLRDRWLGGGTGPGAGVSVATPMTLEVDIARSSSARSTSTSGSRSSPAS